MSHEDIHPGGSQGCRHQLDFLATLLSGDFETSENVNQEGKQEYEQNGQPTRSVSSVKICSVKEEREFIFVILAYDIYLQGSEWTQTAQYLWAVRAIMV